MSWLANLAKTYDHHSQFVGVFERKGNDREYALIPVSHTTQSAHVEVWLDAKGNFLRAEVVPKHDSSTIIPCTEASASRTSKPVPYPLFDKLMYVAGDYVRFCGEVKGTPFADYLLQLRAWCDSPYGHPKLESVYEYLSKGTLIEDLVRYKQLWADYTGKLLEKWEPKEGQGTDQRPDIFKVIASDQCAAFVRFAVDVPGEPEPRLWRDASVQRAFIGYYESLLSEQDLCFVTGECTAYADKHASRIRHSGDKSKLISANDSSGFTYRGRFRTSKDAAAVSYEVSQKAHNALKWLIERQGFAIDGKTFVVWGTEQLDVPDPLADSFLFYQEEEETTIGDSTQQEYARQIRKGINGYRFENDYKANVVIMVLDAATPGRMSIVYYRDMNKELFLNRVQYWHETCLWLHRYRKNGDQFKPFYGAPATRDIAFAAYGSKAGDKTVKELMERMLPCVLDKAAVPLDIVRSAVYRASNPMGMEMWEWEKTLSITCALVNKHFEKEGYEVALNVENTDRSYLFGRMLAIADVLERRVLSDEKRATNALRYMNAFAQHPRRTWKVIQFNLQPYQAKMGSKDIIVNHCNRLLDEVGAKLAAEDFSDRPLTGLYLLGYYSQRHDLYTSKKDKETQAAGQESTETTSEQEEK